MNTISREILFRGKRIDNGEWVKGYLWRGADHTYITPDNLGVDYNEETHRITAFAEEVIPETVGQYTGWTDKNGKKIFEGDIIEYSDVCDWRRVYFKAVVSCEEGAFGICEDGIPIVAARDDFFVSFWDVKFNWRVTSSRKHSLAVVGNIHDCRKCSR